MQNQSNPYDQYEVVPSASLTPVINQTQEGSDPYAGYETVPSSSLLPPQNNLTNANQPQPLDEEKSQPWYTNIYDSFERSTLAGFNAQVADMLQTPISAGLELYQMGFGGNVNPNLPGYDPDDHVMGARAVKDLFEAIGINVTPPEDSLGARVGEEIAYGMAGYGAVGALARGSKYTFGVLEPILSTVRQAPAKALLADIGISVPAGAGGYVGGNLGGETGDSLGTLAGAMSPMAASRQFLSSASNYIPGAGMAKRSALSLNRARKSLGLGEEGQRRAAQEIFLANMSKDSRDRIRDQDFEKPTVGRYTTAELLGDDSMLQAQAAVTARSPDSRETAKQALRATTQDLGDELGRLNPGEVGPTDYIRTRIASAANAVQARMESAVAKAQSRIDKLSSNSPVDLVAKIAREEFDKVYGTARTREKEFWKNVGSGQFKTDTIVESAKEIVERTPRLSGEGGEADIPLAIREIAGKDAYIDPKGNVVPAEESILRTEESLEEVQALMSRLGREQRVARSEGNLNRARLLGNLRDSIFEKIMPVDGPSKQLDEARAFSRRLNEVFYHGSLGQLLDKNAKGGLTVAPELTLERLIGTGVKGKVGANNLRQAAQEYGGLDKIDGVIQDYLKAKFAGKVFVNGQFNPSSAQRFVAGHNALDLYPQLKSQMLDAAKAEQLARSVGKSRGALMERIEKQSLAYKFLESREPSAALNAILSSKNPIKDTNNLVKLAKKDPSGNTLKGLQSALYEILVDRFGTSEVGEYVLTPNKMHQFLKNKTNQHLVQSVFGPDSLKMLNQVTKGASFKASSVQAAQKLRGTESDDLARLTMASRTLGALIGAKISTYGDTKFAGKGLMMAGIGGRHMQRVVRSIYESNKEDVMLLVEKALYDPEFAKELIKPLSEVKTARGEMSLRKFGAFNELIGETPDAIFATSEELMP